MSELWPMNQFAGRTNRNEHAGSTQENHGDIQNDFTRFDKPANHKTNNFGMGEKLSD